MEEIKKEQISDGQNKSSAENCAFSNLSEFLEDSVESEAKTGQAGFYVLDALYQRLPNCVDWTALTRALRMTLAFARDADARSGPLGGDFSLSPAEQTAYLRVFYF